MLSTFSAPALYATEGFFLFGLINANVIDDRVTDEKKVRQIETEMNNQLRQFNKMFDVGTTWGQEDRVTGVSTSTNVPPPSNYGVRKDHKDPHPVRPVCGATEAQ
jgi:hypothetical protein